MKKFLFTAVAVLTISASAYVYTQRNSTTTLNDLAMENIEALASGEGTTHTLSCGSSGVKMCEATCGICQVTLKNWGNGGTATLSCSRR